MVVFFIDNHFLMIFIDILDVHILSTYVQLLNDYWLDALDILQLFWFFHLFLHAC